MRLDWTYFGLPPWLNALPTVTLAGIGLSLLFLAMSYSKGQKDMRYLSLSALAYALVPMWPMIAG